MWRNYSERVNGFTAIPSAHINRVRRDGSLETVINTLKIPTFGYLSWSGTNWHCWRPNNFTWKWIHSYASTYSPRNSIVGGEFLAVTVNLNSRCFLMLLLLVPYYHLIYGCCCCNILTSQTVVDLNRYPGIPVYLHCICGINISSLSSYLLLERFKCIEKISRRKILVAPVVVQGAVYVRTS